MIHFSPANHGTYKQTAFNWRSMLPILLLTLSSALACFGPFGAFIAKSHATPLGSLENESITALPQSDRRFMDLQRNSINALALRHLGRQLRQEPGNDLDILQQLLDQQLVRAHQTAELQAMGIVLGDLYIKELGVHWVIFRDKQGRNRALQWDNRQEVLFPATMISRRVEAGIHVDVKEIYLKGQRILKSIISNKNR